MKFRLLLEDIASVKKQFPNMSNELFYKLIAFDPTYEDGKDRVGTYGKWILNNYNKGNITDSDFGHLKDALTRFEDNKKNLVQKDIGKYKTVAELDAMLNDEDSYKELSHRQEVRQRQKARRDVDLEEEAALVYEDNDWEVWVPHTYAASCKLGQGATWCTASTENDYYYNYYKENFGGEYYININKHDPERKYQFHFESAQFMDRDDMSINLVAFLEQNEGLKNFYYPIVAQLLGLNLNNPYYELHLNGEEVARMFEGREYSGYRRPDGWIDNDFILKIVNSLYGYDDELMDELWGWDWRWSTSLDQLVDAVRSETDPSFFDDLPISREALIWLLEVDGFEDEDVEEEADELGVPDRLRNYEAQDAIIQAVGNAVTDAYEVGTYGQIIDDFKEACKNTVYGSSIIQSVELDEGGMTINADTKDIIETYLDGIREDVYTAENILEVIFLEHFKFIEPRYGWSEFDGTTFRESLEDLISQELKL